MSPTRGAFAGVVANLGVEWYNDLVGEGPVERLPELCKKRRVARQPPHLAVLHDRMVQLRLVERRLDRILRQILDDLDQEEMSRAHAELDTLVSLFPELRLSNVGGYSEQVGVLMDCLDPEEGPLPGFEEAMEQLCELVAGPYALSGLRSRLYTVAARAVDACPELLPSVALAACSLDNADVSHQVFVEMVVCASAIEWYFADSLIEPESPSLDATAWLAAQPSDVLMKTAGEQRAYYYASIAGVFTWLDADRVLFDFGRLASCARTLFPSGPASFRSCGSRDGGWLDGLVDRRYKKRLGDEIRHVQRTLHAEYPSEIAADMDMLTRRALESLDDLPPQVNPLLQAIFVQSWVRYFEWC
jgi:hypothetical protein